MMQRKYIAILLAVGPWLFSSPVFGQVEGTYKFVLCEAECASTESIGALAAGEIILFPDSSFAREIPDDVMSSLRLWSRRLMRREGGFNACFRIPHRVERVGGHELFAGIIEEGLTRWEVQEGEINIRLYQSPDGFFTVFGTVEDGRIRGRGEQAHGLDPRPPDRAFLAERVGPPDPNRCTGALEGGKTR